MPNQIISDKTQKIYVACLSSYNSAVLYGEWIDATLDEELIYEEIEKMLKGSPIEEAEEWEIHDSEYIGIKIDRYHGIGDIVKIVEFEGKYGALGVELVNKHNLSMEEAAKEIDEKYIGCYSSIIEFAQEIIEEQGIPDFICRHIDYGAVAMDLLIDSVYTAEIDGECHIFSKQQK